MTASYDLGEFVSYSFEENEDGSFQIVMKGPKRFSALFLHKMSELKILEKDLIEYVADYAPAEPPKA